MSSLTLCGIICALLLSVVEKQSGQALPGSIDGAANGDVLHSVNASKLLPAKLRFRGEEVLVEQRNSDGIRFSDGAYLLAAMVDISGHSAGKREQFLTYLTTQVPLDVSGHALGPGIYDFGLDGGHRFSVRDAAAHLVFTVDTDYDAALVHPRPLQIFGGPHTSAYRLYLGRDYVVLSRVNQSEKR